MRPISYIIVLIVLGQPSGIQFVDPFGVLHLLLLKLGVHSSGGPSKCRVAIPEGSGEGIVGTGDCDKIGPGPPMDFLSLGFF